MAESIENFRLPEFSRLAPGERFDALVDTSRRADTQGLLCPLPATRAEVREEATFPSRIRTIRTRLFLLGYLGRDSKSGTLDARLRGAVRAFQTEAAITVDGWVGRETWKSLEELLSFETPHDLARWFSGGHANPALARAAQVRLHVLGLLRSRHPRTGKKVESALERFALLADLLDLAPGRLRPALSPETLAVLFDHDAIAARMTRADDAFAFNRPRDIARGKARRLLRKFIICTAKIELWLHGFDVPLSGRADFEHPRRLPSTPERYPLHHALYEFWRGAGQTDAEARRSAMTITGRFFRRLQELHEEADKVPDRAGIARLYETLARATPGVLRDIRDQIRSVGSRIWDGLKRAWRWFKSLLARGIRKVTAGTKNLARLAFRYAAAAFASVRMAVTMAVTAARFVGRRTVPGSDPRHLVIRRDVDFDYSLYIARTADPEKVQALLAVFSRQALRFGTAMKVLGLLTDALMATMERTALGGWFGFVLSLVKINGDLGRLRHRLAPAGAARASP